MDHLRAHSDGAVQGDSRRVPDPLTRRAARTVLDEATVGGGREAGIVGTSCTTVLEGGG